MPNVNKSGYWVQSHKDGSLKTYACSSLKGLKDLILHLTGREADTFSKDTRGLPNLQSLGITIAYPLHIWE
jgi:hypothetical protein